jgi:hypothetical protein
MAIDMTRADVNSKIAADLATLTPAPVAAAGGVAVS